MEPGGMSSSMLSAIDAMSASNQGKRLLVWFAAACLFVALIATGSLICQQRRQESVWVREVTPNAPAKKAITTAPVPKTAPVVPRVSAPASPESKSTNPTQIEPKTAATKGAQELVKRHDQAEKPPQPAARSKSRAEDRGQASASKRGEDRSAKGSTDKTRKTPVKPKSEQDDLLLNNPYLKSP
jgi:type IV secretory pathway VirB10-like protein